MLFENSSDIILFVRWDGKIIEANEAAVSAYGYSHDEMLARTIFDLRLPLNPPLSAEQLAAADATGILFETEHRRRDQSTFPVEVNARGIEIGDQRVTLSIIRDVTQRRNAEEALRKSEEWGYRTLFSTMNEAFALCEND